jgi:hypothetical protein
MHYDIEGPIDERQVAGNTLHDRSGARRPLSDHGHRRLERDNPAVDRFVASRARADVQD